MKNQPYISIIKLFENENYPWEYDFKNENTNDIYQKKSAKRVDDSLYTFALYKNDKTFDTDGTLLDNVDNEKYACQLTREIYRVLFGFKDRVDEINISRYGDCIVGSKYGPDTMNTFMKVGEKLIFNEFKEKLEKEDIFRKNSFFSNKFLIHIILEKELSVELEEKIKIFNYLDAITTMGNYCLVPAYFNPYRGTKFDDYFDLSLINLKCKKNNEIWKCIGNTISWEAKKFNDFINEFFLWDYIQFANNTYDVKDMFDINYKNRTSKCINTERRENEINEVTMLTFIENAIWSIKRRGFLMTLLLKLYIGDYKKYLDVRKSMRASNVYSMNDTINTILRLCGMDKIETEILDAFTDKDIYDIYYSFQKKINII